MFFWQIYILGRWVILNSEQTSFWVNLVIKMRSTSNKYFIISQTEILNIGCRLLWKLAWTTDNMRTCLFFKKQVIPKREKKILYIYYIPFVSLINIWLDISKHNPQSLSLYQTFLESFQIGIAYCQSFFKSQPLLLIYNLIYCGCVTWQ